MNGIRFHTAAMRLDQKRQRVAPEWWGVGASLLRVPWPSPSFLR